MTFDAVIIGAGPAGSAVASALASSGARVAVVAGRTAAGVEGLSERSLVQLKYLGIDPAELGGIGAARRVGTWGADARPVKGVEWLVDRSVLAEAVRSRAELLGARYFPGTVTRSARNAATWRHRLVDGTELEAPVVVEARGRRGPEVAGPRLVALGQRRRFAAAQAAAGTAIRPFSGGWAWWAWRRDELWVQVVTLPRSGPIANRVRQAGAELPDLADALSQTSPAGALLARPAHARLGVAEDRPGWWVTGDKAMALDPMSGQGVYEALVGAKVVATAVTGVAAGDDEALARQFVAERYRATFGRGVRAATGLYAENGSIGDFWRTVGRAYGKLCDVQDETAARVERRPVLDGGRIRAEDVVVTPRHPRGVWQVAGVSVAKLMGCLHRDARLSIESAALELDRPPGDIVQALRWLQEAGVVAG